MSHLKKLKEIRAAAGKPLTVGLPDDIVEKFIKLDPTLGQAIDDALANFGCFKAEFPELVKLDEQKLAESLQEGYLNFYALDATNPYVAIAAQGPWIITSHGAVVHDNGGYGMLGMGHGPKKVIQAMTPPYVMANIMTPAFAQKRFMQKIRKEVGYTRGQCPYDAFICMNSGSESVTVAARISDCNARIQTDPGGRHQGKKIMFLALSHGFHGRTDRPAQASDSSMKSYKKYLASFRDRENLLTVEPNDVNGLEKAFKLAADKNMFIECMLMEPVMGEGDPGKAITPEFYKKARELTKANNSLLLVDSIQAALRAQGCLSIVDYPGFEKLDPPDMETYSKALNAGQYPLSVLALRGDVAKLYQRGIYGNTMTTNPRALEVGCAVLDSITPELRRNIRERGEEFVKKLSKLAEELPGTITKVQGTGLLFSAELNPKKYKAYGANSIEEYLRQHGVGVIHGGESSLRFTPPFNITSAEVELVVDGVRRALKEGPQLK